MPLFSTADLVAEHPCAVCFKETLHEERDSALFCKTCGTVSEFINSSEKSKEIGIGVSSEGASGRGESGEGEIPPSVPPSASTPNAYAEMLHGESLVALDGDPSLGRFIFEKAGLTFLQDEPQPITFGETTVLVRLWVDDHDLYVVRPVSEVKVPTFPGTAIRALKLGQFYASICAGRIIGPTGPELARWKRRALTEWGVVAPPSVVLRPLPEDAPRYVAPVWNRICLLMAVRRLIEPDERLLPLTRSFVPAWCGCDEQQARRALGWLDRNGFIWRAETMDVGKPKPMTLWAIAEVEPEQ
jgi:hypothetical protein